MRGNRIVDILATVMASVIAVAGIGCTWIKLKDINSSTTITLLASNLSMPQGFATVTSAITSKSKTTTATIATQPYATEPPTEKSTNSNKKITDDESKYKGTKYPVIEQNFTGTGENYNNFYVKNSTDYSIDYPQALSAEFGFEITNTDNPQVLIVHTHTTESYLINDNGYYYTDYPFRTTDSEKNMVAVGNEIVKSLKSNGIGAIQATEIHDTTYTGSYDRSAETIYKYLEEYPDIKVVFDIHRDAVGYDDERGKYKPTFTYDGKKAAQIMIMCGYDPYDSYGFGHWNENLNFALQLQQTAENMYPGMTRPLYFGDFAYNMYINNGSLLIEVGTETNTLEEAKYTGSLLGNVIAKTLKPN